MTPPTVVRAMNDTDETRRQAVGQRCTALITQGECPTCRQFAHGDVFPDQATFYEDADVTCLLEAFPRGSGHTVILARTHYADIAAMPVTLGCHIMRVAHAVTNALKHLMGAEKVYMVTMCSGKLSHLHFQLIPRLPGEMIGGRVFASPRGVLVHDAAFIATLNAEVTRRLAEDTPLA